jgi:hypothetical protein
MRPETLSEYLRRKEREQRDTLQERITEQFCREKDKAPVRKPAQP